MDQLYCWRHDGSPCFAGGAHPNGLAFPTRPDTIFYAHGRFWGTPAIGDLDDASGDRYEIVLASAKDSVYVLEHDADGDSLRLRWARSIGNGELGAAHASPVLADVTADGRLEVLVNSARDGRLSVVVGTRSAVFVPLPRLRLVVIDEEHEWAYKQEESPRYHGRDVAVMRASLARAVAILGSATPSLESLWNADRGKYRRLRLPERVDGRPAAKVMVVDLKPGVDGDGETADHPSASRNKTGGTESESRSRAVSPGRRNPVSLLSPGLSRAVQHRLERGEQTILFLNRRGHSPIVQCSECGRAVLMPRGRFVRAVRRLLRPAERDDGGGGPAPG